MRKIYVEIELNGIITAKSLLIPEDMNKYDSVKLNNYVRNYFKELGYEVGVYIKIC